MLPESIFFCDSNRPPLAMRVGVAARVVALLIYIPVQPASLSSAMTDSLP
jgi:hypothetical protein